MKKEIIKSLMELKHGLVIIGKSISSDKDHFFIINSVHNLDRENITNLEFVEINKHFTKWSISLPTHPNKKLEFVSENNPDFSFVFFKTKYVAEELYHVLLNHMTPEE